MISAALLPQIHVFQPAPAAAAAAVAAASTRNAQSATPSISFFDAKRILPSESSGGGKQQFVVFE